MSESTATKFGLAGEYLSEELGNGANELDVYIKLGAYFDSKKKHELENLIQKNNKGSLDDMLGTVYDDYILTHFGTETSRETFIEKMKESPTITDSFKNSKSTDWGHLAKKIGKVILGSMLAVCAVGMISLAVGLTVASFGKINTDGVIRMAANLYLGNSAMNAAEGFARGAGTIATSSNGQNKQKQLAREIETVAKGIAEDSFVKAQAKELGKAIRNPEPRPAAPAVSTQRGHSRS